MLNKAQNETVGKLLALVKPLDEGGESCSQGRNGTSQQEDHQQARADCRKGGNDHHGHECLGPLGRLDVGLTDERNITGKDAANQTTQETGAQNIGNHTHDEARSNTGAVRNGKSGITRDESGQQPHA